MFRLRGECSLPAGGRWLHTRLWGACAPGAQAMIPIYISTLDDRLDQNIRNPCSPHSAMARGRWPAPPGAVLVPWAWPERAIAGPAHRYPGGAQPNLLSPSPQTCQIDGLGLGGAFRQSPSRTLDRRMKK